MARKANKRKIGVRILLTNKAYLQVESAAFKNCRTVSQELTYMVERQLVDRKEPKFVEMERFDGPQAPIPAPEEFVSENTDNIPPASDWSPEMDKEVHEKCVVAGLTDGQESARRLLYKTPEAVLESLQEKSAA